MSQRDTVTGSAMTVYRGGGVQTAVLNALGISRCVSTQERDLLDCDGTVVVDSLDMRMHGEVWLRLVRLCFDYKLGLVIENDNGDALVHLADRFVMDEGMERDTAVRTIGALFPQHTFIHNTEEQKINL